MIERVLLSESTIRVALACMADATIKGSHARALVAAEDELAAALKQYTRTPTEPPQPEAK